MKISFIKCFQLDLKFGFVEVYIDTNKNNLFKGFPISIQKLI